MQLYLWNDEELIKAYNYKNTQKGKKLKKSTDRSAMNEQNYQFMFASFSYELLNKNCFIECLKFFT